MFGRRGSDGRMRVGSSMMSGCWKWCSSRSTVRDGVCIGLRISTRMGTSGESVIDVGKDVRVGGRRGSRGRGGRDHCEKRNDVSAESRLQMIRLSGRVDRCQGSQIAG